LKQDIQDVHGKSTLFNAFRFSFLAERTILHVLCEGWESTKPMSGFAKNHPAYLNGLIAAG